nr:D-alanyl-D-alanine carboxypeptidase/D-alanyl-D-alanine-endopeptidase [Luteibacter jiangsuensis]
MRARLMLSRSVAACMILLVSVAHAEGVGTRIERHLAEPRFAAASWGISVVSLDDGRTVYAHDAGRLMLPASTAKLYTAAFALDRLGPDFRTRTDVLANGAMKKGRLRGDIVLRGGGDPTLSGDAWANNLAAALRERGIRRIDGAVVGDDTLFAGPPIGAGWEASDLQETYGAQAGGLDIDENTMTVALAGPRVDVRPRDAAITVAIDSAEAPPNDAPARTPEFYRAPGSDTLHVIGLDNASAKPHTARIAMPDPALVAARRLESALHAQGVRVDSEARSVRWPVRPPGGELLASWPSPTLLEILQAGLKRSQNLYLQTVFLLAGRSQGADATPAEDRATAALSDWLAARGIGPTSVAMTEGSGLSRHDLTTASALTRLLATMDTAPGAAAWRSLLPVAGVDGTLARRMRGTAAEGNVVAKTGSMTYVNALAGYVTTASGQRLAFAILLNNYRPPPHGAEPLRSASAEVDAIAVMLAEATGRL